MKTKKTIKLLKDIKKGMSVLEASKKYGVIRETIYYWLNKTGIKPLRSRNFDWLKIKAQLEGIGYIIRENGDVYQIISDEGASSNGDGTINQAFLIKYIK